MLAGARPCPARLQAQSVVQMLLPNLSAAHEKQGLQAVKMYYYIIYIIYILFHVSRQLLLSHDNLKMLTIGTSVQPHTPDSPPSLNIF